MIPQTAYYIPKTPECDTNYSDCNQIKKLDSSLFTFYLHWSDKVQYYGINIMDANGRIVNKSNKPYGLNHNLKGYLLQKHQFWPKGWHNTGQIYKASAFWPKKYYFVYIMNGKTSNDTAVLATNSLLNKNWTNCWNYTQLVGYEGKLFTAAFWWRQTDSIYVVIENRNERTNDRRDAFVYRFDSENLKNPFIPTVCSTE